MNIFFKKRSDCMWSKTLGGINKVTKYMTSGFLIVMVVIIFLYIVSRIVSQSFFSWTEELARFLMIWLTFLGAAFYFHHGVHIGISMLSDKLPKKVSAIITLLDGILCSVLFVILTVKGF